MADISKIKILDGTICNIRDSRIPPLTLSESTYLRGDGTWAIPFVDSGNKLIFIDGGDHLLVQKIIVQAV